MRQGTLIDARRSPGDELPARGAPAGGDDRAVPVEEGLSSGLTAFAGRLAEVSGSRTSAALSFAARLVLEAQRRQDPAAWITRQESAFFPPDLAEAGIDLDALVVVWVVESLDAARAADHLLRSGSFGLVVMDLGESDRLPLRAQSRLAGLARKHAAAAVCLTEKERHRPSLGSLVSLRVHATRTRGEDSRFRCELRVLKDKRRGPGREHVEICRGPDGLR